MFQQARFLFLPLLKPGSFLGKDGKERSIGWLGGTGSRLLRGLQRRLKRVESLAQGLLSFGGSLGGFLGRLLQMRMRKPETFQLGGESLGVRRVANVQLRLTRLRFHTQFINPLILEAKFALQEHQLLARLLQLLKVCLGR